MCYCVPPVGKQLPIGGMSGRWAKQTSALDSKALTAESAWSPGKKHPRSNSRGEVLQMHTGQ